MPTLICFARGLGDRSVELILVADSSIMELGTDLPDELPQRTLTLVRAGAHAGADLRKRLTKCLPTLTSRTTPAAASHPSKSW